MEIMKLIKDSLGIQGELDEKTAKEIIQTLDADIQKAKAEQEQIEKDARIKESQEWSRRVAEARNKQKRTYQARKKSQQVKGYSAGRMARLCRLGKID